MASTLIFYRGDLPIARPQGDEMIIHSLVEPFSGMVIDSIERIMLSSHTEHYVIVKSESALSYSL
jgi:hypothetical protein